MFQTDRIEDPSYACVHYELPFIRATRCTLYAAYVKDIRTQLKSTVQRCAAMLAPFLSIQMERTKAETATFFDHYYSSSDCDQ